MTYFYAKIIHFEAILKDLETLDLSDSEKAHLSALVDSQLHHVIMDEILSNLKEEDKELFLRHLKDSDDTKILEFLTERVDGVEEKIKKAADSLTKELHKDIREAKKVKGAKG